MALDPTDDDEPPFAVTVYGIMGRYRTGAVERLTARRALSAITLALAPEALLDDYAEETLAAFFGTALDRYRSGNDAAGDEVVRIIVAAAAADWVVLGRHGIGR